MYLPDRYEFFNPTKISSGNKALENLPTEMDALGTTKPFLITSKEISQKGFVKKVINALKDSGLSLCVFDGVPRNADVQAIKHINNLFDDSGCDVLIALGSGDLIDTAKALNILISGNSDLDKFSGENKIPSPLKPLILIPTSPGNGYESTRFAFFEEKNFSSHFLMPDLVVIDQRMIIKENISYVVSGAMVALTHAVEAYIGASKNPLTDTYASTAMQAVVQNLLGVIPKFGFRKRRLALINAEAMAGCVFSNTKPGTTHILGKETAPYTNFPIGVLMGILLPYVLKNNLSKNGSNISELLLPMGGIELYSVSKESTRPIKAINILHELYFDLHQATKGDIPYTLKQAGIPEDSLIKIAQSAKDLSEGDSDNENFLTILEHAWDGACITKT